MRELIIGSRGSALAMAQTQWVIAQLKQYFPQIEIKVQIFRTQGDRSPSTPLTQTGDKGIFVKELQIALIKGQIDLAVHSLKDLPTEEPEGLALLAVPLREDPRDALILRPSLESTPEELKDLPLAEGMVVGTSSPRRRAQLRYHRPDLRFIEFRGNVDTRLRKLQEGQADACVLAMAGLNRLGITSIPRYPLAPSLCLPAPGQGALAIEGRMDREDLKELLQPLEDKKSRMEVETERALLSALGGGCRLPIAALGRYQDGVLKLSACVAHPEGSQVIYAEAIAAPEKPVDLGQKVAQLLRERGAADLLREQVSLP